MFNIPATVEKIFLEEVQRQLVEGRKHKVNKKTTKIIQEVDKETGEFVTVARTLTTEITEKEDPVDTGILQMVANALSLNNAIAFLEQKGYTVVDPTLVDDEKTLSNQGVSEDLIEALKANALGIPALPPSKEVDSSEPGIQ